MTLHALVVEHDPETLRTLAETIRDQGFEVDVSRDPEEARELVEASRFDLLVLDLRMPSGTGLELLDALEDRRSTEVVAVDDRDNDHDAALGALQLGASHWLEKPINPRRLERILDAVRRNHEIRDEARTLQDRLREQGPFGRLLGDSASMQKLREEVRRVAPTDATVLITGESGTGKELVARTIHDFSRRRDGPYIPVNCGAIAPNLIESELFGHERGSFTGASRRHEGLFERANGGTLFLDEIAEMPVEAQAKLLRVLETDSILRVGGDHQVSVDVRLIAATNRPPEEAVTEGRLREDLLYRLSVFPLDVPPLRERDHDVEVLAAHFLARMNQSQGTAKKLAPGSAEFLRHQRWPGNVRELKNTLHRAFILAEEEIRLDESILRNPANPAGNRGTCETGNGPRIPVRVGMSLAEVERRVILATLEAYGGDKRRTGQVLGISLRTLYNRLKSYREGGEAGDVADSPGDGASDARQEDDGDGRGVSPPRGWTERSA